MCQFCVGGALILWGYNTVNTFSPSDQPQFFPDHINMWLSREVTLLQHPQLILQGNPRMSAKKKIYMDSYNQLSSLIMIAKYDILGFHSLAVWLHFIVGKWR